MVETRPRRVLVTDRVDVPLDAALRLAAELRTSLDVVWRTPAAWMVAAAYAEGPVPALAEVEPVARRRLRARLEAACRSTRVAWTMPTTGLEELDVADLVLLAHPSSLAEVAETPASAHVPGPGRAAAAAVLAFTGVGDRAASVTDGPVHRPCTLPAGRGRDRPHAGLSLPSRMIRRMSGRSGGDDAPVRQP